VVYINIVVIFLETSYVSALDGFVASVYALQGNEPCMDL